MPSWSQAWLLELGWSHRTQFAIDSFAMDGAQLFRVFICVAWCAVSIVLGVACCFVGGWIFNVFAFGFALSTAVSAYIARQEWSCL